METIQKTRKTSDAQLRASLNYANSKWRPNIFLNKAKKEDIEKHYREIGLNSFNEYVMYLIEKDAGISVDELRAKDE